MRLISELGDQIVCHASVPTEAYKVMRRRSALDVFGAHLELLIADSVARLPPKKMPDRSESNGFNLSNRNVKQISRSVLSNQ